MAAIGIADLVKLYFWMPYFDWTAFFGGRQADWRLMARFYEEGIAFVDDQAKEFFAEAEHAAQYAVDGEIRPKFFSIKVIE